MKTALILITLLVTTQTFAAKCLIQADTFDGNECGKITTRLDVPDIESCESFAKSSNSTSFFGLLESEQKLASVRYAFKDKKNNKDVEDVYVQGDESTCY